MKIVVTGALGFVGSNLVDSLISLGHEVKGIDNLSSASSTLENCNRDATYEVGDF